MQCQGKLKALPQEGQVVIHGIRYTPLWMKRFPVYKLTANSAEAKSYAEKFFPVSHQLAPHETYQLKSNCPSYQEKL